MDARGQSATPTVEGATIQETIELIVLDTPGDVPSILEVRRQDVHMTVERALHSLDVLLEPDSHGVSAPTMAISFLRARDVTVDSEATYVDGSISKKSRTTEPTVISASIIPMGAMVKFHGVRNMPKINGRRGIIMAYKSQSHRYLVK